MGKTAKAGRPMPTWKIGHFRVEMTSGNPLLQEELRRNFPPRKRSALFKKQVAGVSIPLSE